MAIPAVLCIHGGFGLAHAGYNSTILKRRRTSLSHGHMPSGPQVQFPARFAAPGRSPMAASQREEVSHRSQRIGVTGGSAGGHLALFLGVTGDVKEFEGDQNPGQSSKVACVVDVYGPSDFTKSYGKSVDAAEVLPLWLGGDLKTALPAHLRASPLYWVTPNSAPTLCIHGTKDTYVHHEQSQWLVDKMKAAGVEAELLLLEGAGHGFKGEDSAKAEKAMMGCFAKG